MLNDVKYYRSLVSWKKQEGTQKCSIRNATKWHMLIQKHLIILLCILPFVIEMTVIQPMVLQLLLYKISQFH